MPAVNNATECEVCTAAPGGFGWMQPLPQISILFGRRSRSLPKNRERKRFCSTACQSLFTKAFEGGIAVDRKQLDKKAKHDALIALGDYVAQIGMAKPLVDYSKEEAQGIVNSILSAYQQSLKNNYPKEK